jgi:lysozyme
MRTSDAGIELIKGFEGLRLDAYQDAAGVWTIGYGHTGQDVRPGDTITEEEAERLLRLDLTAAELAVAKYVKVPLNQHQFDALVSWTYNLGAGNLKESTLLRLLNDAQYDHAAQQFGLWVHADRKKLPGLVKRRAAERFLFEQPMTAPAAEQPPAPVEERTLPPYRQETAMPAPLVVPILSALVPALLPALVEKLPDLAKIFGDRDKASKEQYAEAGVKVLEIVTAATGARNAQEAVERVAADPAAKSAAEEQLRARWFDLQEVAGGIAAARESNATLPPLPRIGLRFHELLTLMAMTGAYAVGGAYLFTGSPAPEMAAALVTALVIATLASVMAYWFGSTSGSALKSELLARKP